MHFGWCFSSSRQPDGLSSSLSLKKQSKMNRWELCLTMGGSRCVSASMRRDEDGIQLGLDWQLWKTRKADITQHELNDSSGRVWASFRLFWESRGCWKTKMSEPVGLKLKRWGSSRPLGSRVFGWRNSSKKVWEQASNGENREAGVYSSRREHRVMASGGVRGLNTWSKNKTSPRVQHKIMLTDTGSDTGHRLSTVFTQGSAFINRDVCVRDAQISRQVCECVREPESADSCCSS